MAHCDTRAHCKTCRTNPRWRREVFGDDWVCPLGAESVWSDEAVQAERERQRKSAESAKVWQAALAECWLAAENDPTAEMLLNAYRERPCCAAKRHIIQWRESARLTAGS